MRPSSLKPFSQSVEEEDSSIPSLLSKDAQVSLIRGELVALTGNHFLAIVLNQLLYWTQRVKDFDLMLEEEKALSSYNEQATPANGVQEFNSKHCISPRYGWIYKTAHELIKETLLTVSHPTMRKYLKQLVDYGWIDERRNPLDKWNKTTQYRVNLRKLQKALTSFGRSLPNVYFRVFSSFSPDKVHSNPLIKAVDEASNIKSLQSNERNLNLEENSLHSNGEIFHSDENPHISFLDHPAKSKKISDERNLRSDERNFASKKNSLRSDVRNFPSNVKNLHSYTYTENTPKNTNREHAQRTHAREDFHEFFEIWKKHVCQEALQLTETRKRQLSALLSLHFQNDVQQWERFCERIKASSFLMGAGGRRWHVTLDWILSEDNALKVLEGNFDNPENLQLKKSEAIQDNRDQEKMDILASIQDPTWQDWCTQLSYLDQKKDPLSLLTLKEIADARFAEFDGKLVWVESESPKTLSRINDLRLKLLTVVQQTFPKARNIRTQLSPLKAGEGFVTSNPCSSPEHRLALPLEANLKKKQPTGEFYAE